jgi:hypothetical protein
LALVDLVSSLQRCQPSAQAISGLCFYLIILVVCNQPDDFRRASRLRRQPGPQGRVMAVHTKRILPAAGATVQLLPKPRRERLCQNRGDAMSDAHWAQCFTRIVDQRSLEQCCIRLPIFTERLEYRQAVALIHGRHLIKQLLLARVKVLGQVLDRRLCCPRSQRQGELAHTVKAAHGDQTPSIKCLSSM